MRNTKRRPPGPRLTRTTGYTHSRMPLDGYGFVLIVRSSPTSRQKGTDSRRKPLITSTRFTGTPGPVDRNRVLALRSPLF